MIDKVSIYVFYYIVFSIHSFTKFTLIANGTFGPIYRVICKVDNKPYCLKVYHKVKVLLNGSLPSILSEIEFYKKFNKETKCITELHYAFQDNTSFYLICEFCVGGDLRYHLNQGSLNEHKAKFIIACIILALEFIHTNSYSYRDLKPENILIDSYGYAKLSDFELLIAIL